MSLDQALAELAGRWGQAAPQADDSPTVVELSIDDRIQAQSHYVRGRDAAVEGRSFLAIQEFEQAHAIDPSSAAILRQLARAYNAAGNSRRSLVLYQQILALDAADSEALFALGSAAAQQGRFEEAARYLASASDREGGFDHDSAANALAHRFVAVAMHQLGYVRAERESLEAAMSSIEALTEPTVYAAELQWMIAHQGDLYRAIGDAHARLGEYEAALQAYRLAGSAEGADHASLLQRRAYVLLLLGRPHSVQLAFLQSVRSGDVPVDSRLIDLAGYLRLHGASSRDLSIALSDAGLQSTDSILRARLAAALLPSREGAVELRRIIAEHPQSLETIEQWLALVDLDDADSAAALAVELAESEPDESAEYARLLFARFGLAPALIEAFSGDGRAVARLLESQLFLLSGAAAEAYHAAQAGLSVRPELPALHETLIRACGALEEASLLDRAVEAAPPENAKILRAIAQSQQSVGRRDEAIEAATRAAHLAADDAEAHALLAGILAAQPGMAAAARAAAERALSLRPGLDAAYEAIIALHGPAGAQPDQARLQEVINRLRAEAPQGRLFRLLVADERVGQQRFDQAIDLLIALYQEMPEEGEVVRRLALAWLQSNQPDAALAWLRERLESRPHAPSLLQELVRVRLSRQQFLEAEDELRARLDQWPADPVALSMLEVVLQAQGRMNEAWALAEERLMRRPAGHRREIERSALRAAMGDFGAAVRLLAPLLDQGSGLTAPDANRMLGVLSTWQGQSVDSDAEEFLHQAPIEILRRNPELPLTAYVNALMPMLDAPSRDLHLMRELIDQAVQHAEGGTGAAEAIEFRAAAQQLLVRGEAEFAANLLTGRLEADRPLDSQGIAVLAQAAQATLLAANRADELIALVDRLNGDGTLAVIFPRAANPRRDALYSCSILATLMGQADNADLLLKEVLESDPGHAMTLNNLGYHRVEAGAADAQTADMIERAAELLPDDPSIMDTIAWLRYRQGLFSAETAGPPREGALELIERAVDLTAQAGGELSAEVLDHHGDILWRLDRRDEAAAQWRSAIEAIEKPAFRVTTMQSFERFQRDNWGILARPAEEMFRISYEPILARAREKVRALEEGQEPPIAPTFAEMRE
jgi:tetratricopeptide (TPR) repeat protein